MLWQAGDVVDRFQRSDEIKHDGYRLPGAPRWRDRSLVHPSRVRLERALSGNRAHGGCSLLHVPYASRIWIVEKATA
jgi:hypothetical protein